MSQEGKPTPDEELKIPTKSLSNSGESARSSGWEKPQTPLAVPGLVVRMAKVHSSMVCGESRSGRCKSGTARGKSRKSDQAVRSVNKGPWSRSQNGAQNSKNAAATRSGSTQKDFCSKVKLVRKLRGRSVTWLTHWLEPEKGITNITRQSRVRHCVRRDTQDRFLLSITTQKIGSERDRQFEMARGQRLWWLDHGVSQATTIVQQVQIHLVSEKLTTDMVFTPCKVIDSSTEGCTEIGNPLLSDSNEGNPNGAKSMSQSPFGEIGLETRGGNYCSPLGQVLLIHCVRHSNRAVLLNSMVESIQTSHLLCPLDGLQAENLIGWLKGTMPGKLGRLAWSHWLWQPWTQPANSLRLANREGAAITHVFIKWLDRSVIGSLKRRAYTPEAFGKVSRVGLRITWFGIWFTRITGGSKLGLFNLEKLRAQCNVKHSCR